MKRHFLDGLSRFSSVLKGLQDDLLKFLVGGLRTIVTKWPPFNSSKQSPSFFLCEDREFRPKKSKEF